MRCKLSGGQDREDLSALFSRMAPRVASPLHPLIKDMGALNFSSILGLVILFARGGLGVREGVLVYLLALMMPGSIAVVLSILTRLWMTFIEIGLIGVIYLISQFKKRLKKKDLYVQG